MTEKGYCHDPATGALDETHPDIVHDLAEPRAPRSAPGFLVEALRRRRAAGLPPVHGAVLRQPSRTTGAPSRGIVDRFAALRDPELGRFIADEVAFPSTMVDRITPATTDADRARDRGARSASRTPAPVVTEPFTQWVIEDRFARGRGRDWERPGAEFVADVAPYENMKLRLLNGSHSTLAYLGYLAGYETVADTMGDANFARLCRRP